MSVVVISTVTFVLGTMPELTDNIDIMLFDNETEVRSTSLQLALYDVWLQTETPVETIRQVERWEEVSGSLLTKDCTFIGANSLTPTLYVRY